MRTHFWYGLTLGVVTSAGVTFCGQYLLRHPSTVNQILTTGVGVGLRCCGVSDVPNVPPLDPDLLGGRGEQTCLKPDGAIELPAEPEPVVEVSPAPEAAPAAEVVQTAAPAVLPSAVAEATVKETVAPVVANAAVVPASAAPPITVIVQQIGHDLDGVTPVRFMPTCLDDVDEAHLIMPRAEDTVALNTVPETGTPRPVVAASSGFFEFWSKLLDVNIEIELPVFPNFGTKVDPSPAAADHSSKLNPVEDGQGAHQLAPHGHTVRSTSTAAKPIDADPANVREDNEPDESLQEESEPEPRPGHPHLDTMEYRRSDGKQDELKKQPF